MSVSFAAGYRVLGGGMGGSRLAVAVSTVAICMALSGCSGTNAVSGAPSSSATSHDLPAASPVRANPVVSPPSAAPSPRAATGQYARAVAEYDARLRRYYDEIPGCVQDVLVLSGRATSVDIGNNPGLIHCGISTASLVDIAVIISAEFKKLGPPPDEISPLVQQTTTALSPLLRPDIESACSPTKGNPASAECVRGMGAIESNMPGVISVLEAWRVHGG